MSDERKIVKLKHPVSHGSETISELAFRRGRLADMKGVSMGLLSVEADVLMKIAGRMCGQPSAVIEQLDEDDAAEVMRIALGFYMRCLQTGTPA